MDRRRFLTAGAAGAGASALAAPAIAQNKRELRVVTTWPKNFPGLGTAPERVATIVEELTDGRLRMKIYAAGELVPAFEAFDQVSGGGADAYHGAEYYWQGKSKAFSFFAAVPFGLTATEFTAWLSFGGGQELWDELSADFTIKPLPCGNSGHQMGGWFKREIATLDDFVGLKMRIPGLGGAVVKALGGAPVALPGSEIYPALQSGAIDATEWVGPWNDLAFGLYREAKFYYGPGFHEPGTQLSLGINREVWEELPADQKAAVIHACRSVNDLTIGEFAQRNAEALTTLVDDHGVSLRRFSDEIWTAAAGVSEDVVADAAGEDGSLSRRIYDSYITARRALSGWGAQSEAAYMRAREDALNT